MAWDIRRFAGLRFFTGPTGTSVGTLTLWPVMSRAVGPTVLQPTKRPASKAETDVKGAMELSGRLIKPACRKALTAQAQRNR